MAGSERLLLVGFPIVCAACTFTGLGNYTISTCAKPAGVSATVQQVGMVSSSDLTFASINGASPIGAFPTQSAGGSCVQAVGTSGYVESSSCAFFVGLAPEQPWLVPLGGGYGAAAITTTAPCTQGALAFQYIGQSVGGSTTSACPTGVALPSLAPLAADGSTALATWYEAAYPTRNDPIQSCSDASAAPLVVAVVSGATTSNPTLGKTVMLSGTGISVRPAAMATLMGQVVVAAPDGTDVSVWALDASLSTGSTASVPALAGARAVSVGVATDGSGAIAVAAEIGCTPQSIALAVGTISGGFSLGTIVAPAGSGATVQPTVAWVASENHWIVGWISTDGGAHALAQRFDASGDPVGGMIDPSTPATGASVTGDGSLFAYVPGSNSFVSASLGCAE